MSNPDTTPIGNADWIKTDLHPNLRDAVSCDTKTCEQDAVFYTKLSCCQHVVFACKTCMSKTMKTLTVLIKAGQTLACPGCQEEIFPVGWLSRPTELVER